MGLSGWTDGYNNYSNGNFVIDPTGDGNYAAVNVWEDTTNTSGQIELTYIEQKLSNSLVPGSTYELSFQYRRSEVSSKTSEMGIYFTPDIVDSYQIHSTDPPNSLELGWPLNTSLQWHTATIPFVVTGSIPLEYITIGRKNDAAQQSLNNNQYPPYSGEYKGYYFIDDISLVLTNQPNLTFYQIYCNPSGLINLQAENPNSNGLWSLVSGNGNLMNSSTNDVDLSYNGTGNFVIVYSYPYDNCDGSSSWYTETYNIEINSSQNSLTDTLFVCEQQVDLSEYTNGLAGEWTINAGSGVVNNNIYSQYETGVTTVTFTPDPGQVPCQFLSNEITIIYTPYPKTTTNTFDSDVWNDVVIDNYGNIYAVGTYVNNTRIDGNLISSGLLGGSINEQFMVAKYDSCGVLLWHAWGLGACTSNNEGVTTGTSIAYDATYQRIYIAGQYQGMAFRNSNGNSYDMTGGNVCYGDETVAYVLELNSETGNYEDFNGHIGDMSLINSLVVANDGVFNHHLYLGGVNESNIVSNGVIVRLQTHQNFSNQSNLNQSFPSLIASNVFNNSINDLFYKDQIIYSVGTTSGYLSFKQKQVSLNLSSGSTSSWVAATYEDNSGFNVFAIGNGGESPDPTMNRTMTGDEIYVDQHDFIIVAGLYNFSVQNPFNGGVNYFSQSLNPMEKDLYIFKLVQLGPNIQMYPSGTVPPFDFVSSFGPPNSELSSIAMTGFKDNIYISGSYTGNDILFGVSSTTYTPTAAVSEKIFTAHYELYPDFTKTWFNTTRGFNPNSDEHIIKGMCALNNKVYSVGTYQGFMNFQNNNFGPINEIESTLPAGAQFYNNSGFIYRNDHQESGMFKSLKGDDKPKGLETTIVNIYPNPNNGQFVIEGIDELTTIEIVDAIGKKISFSSSFSKDRIFIKINNFVGLAVVKVNDETYRVLVQ